MNITVVMTFMTIVQSRITAQGQISVPSEIRRKLGVGPGSVLEWEDRDGEVIVRRVGRFSSEDAHRTLFPDGPPRKGRVAVKDAIRAYVRQKHARG